MAPIIFVSLAANLAAPPAQAQGIACCNQHIWVNGSWFGMSRVEDCQKYFNSAPPPILGEMCRQRSALTCLNTSRCDQLPPEERVPRETPSSPVALPPNPDGDGLADGFGDPSPAPSPPPAGGLSPPRLVYLMPWPSDGKRVTSFTVWLDRKGCPLPLDQNNRLADSGAATHVIRGKVIRRDGRAKIEAEAQERPGGAKLGPFSGEAEGEDAAAVTKATRAVMEKLKLVCVR